ncbi:MAG TPA: histidine kinase [Thermoanaerobaculia bacterium]|jgi:hypothetical protein
MLPNYARFHGLSHAARRTAFVVGELLVLLLLTATAQASVWTYDVEVCVGDAVCGSSGSSGSSEVLGGRQGGGPRNPEEPRGTRGTPWKRTKLYDIGEVRDVLWIRTRLDLSKMERVPGHPLAIYFGALAAHELWWDGVPIGRGGVVGRSKETEVPGPIESHYQIPDALAGPGVHTVLVRTSAFHRGFKPKNGYWMIGVADYDRMLAGKTRSANLSMIALSGIVLTGVFAFALYWLARRDRSFLLLGALCLSAAALLIAEAWRSLYGYTYDWHIVRLLAVVVTSWLVGVLLVAVVVTRFPHRHGRLVLLVTAALSTIAPFTVRAWDPKSILIFILCCNAAMGWTIFAAVRRQHGSTLALIGVGVATLALAVYPWDWVNDVLYLALNFVFLCLLCSHALEVRREQDERARLELEMVRRQLQPHFLMNTLTALSEWIEQEPKTAVRMIEALAEELRALRELSSRTLVPLEEELRLCRSHIANMALRNDAAYSLHADVDRTRQVPPAVFHTLVENAMTHGVAGEMTLSSHVSGRRVKYVFEAPVPVEPRASARGTGELDGGLKPAAPHQPGAGTRYIEARLREAWGNAWSFTQGRDGNLWRAEIEVPA